MKNFFSVSLVIMAMLFQTACDKTVKNSFEGNEVFVNDFKNRSALFEGTSYLSVFDSALSVEQKEALQFLYAYMPLPDVVDYPGSFHLMNVDYALRARSEMPWGVSVPDREFLHFVLPVRVNNEDLDESRRVFYEELKERVKGLSMYDAVLEVNHWCHEKVTYTPTDIRTSSPLATVRTAYGRCGEESTFTVAALRSVGIPARQVYTPRWAHTDNNHAWVEAWVDGSWHFLGACEPEPVLDLGWFNAPASRGMLMHTNAFGNYNGPEEVLGRTNCTTEINVTSNYAPVATTVVYVVDKNGTPQQDADVEFKIYNYAEFHTAASKKSDKHGCASITSGCGDMIAWASKDGLFGFGKFTAGVTDTLKVVLDDIANVRTSMTMDIVPPSERNTTPELTAEQKEANTKRFILEDSIRNAYVSTFPTSQEAMEFAKSINADSEYVVALIEKSRGNYKVITDFLGNCPKDKQGKAISLLRAISEKDLRDVSLQVLNDHLANTPAADNNKAKYLNNIYPNYILNPRISNEMLTPYKGFFASVIPAEEQATYKENPELWVEWCRTNIKIQSEWNPLSLCMSPKGVWDMRVADPHSRDIFFVAAARSMGIASRIDEVTGKTQYIDKKGKWCDVNFGADVKVQSSGTGKLYGYYRPTQYIDDPRYYSHFTISKIVDGKLQLLGYSENTTYNSLLAKGVDLDAGDYLVITGTRMANGGVLAKLNFVRVQNDNKIVSSIVLQMRESKDELSVIGEFNSENLFYDLQNEQKRSLLSVTGRGYYIIALVDPTNEPTNHFLRDVMPYKEAFEKWGQKIILLFDDVAAHARFKADDFPQLPSTVVMGTDIDKTISTEIIRNMKLENPNLPVILVADTFNRVVFMSQGYSIGLGEQLVKVINQL